MFYFPLAQLHHVVREAVTETSLRSVATQVGVSHATIAAFLANPEDSSEKTKEKIDRWALQQSEDYEGLDLVPDPEAPHRGSGGDVAQAAYLSLVESKEALYQAFNNLGEPGDAENDKASLFELLNKAVTSTRARGKKIDTRYLVEAYTDFMNGDL